MTHFSKPAEDELLNDQSAPDLSESITDLWTDPEFPPTVSSLDGIPDPVSGGSSQGKSGLVPNCRCGLKARQRRVNKDNQNQGRPFFSCRNGGAGPPRPGGPPRCDFFMWADGAGDFGLKHKPVDLETSWVRLRHEDGYVLARDGFRPADVCQGGVGDCWFMSSLAVVAEREDLINRILLDKTLHKSGLSRVRLFIDGKWQYFQIDDHFPHRQARSGTRRKRSKIETGFVDTTNDGALELRYCKANEKQLWVPIVEKAYAKAHGSYAGINGGFIEEALFDLTGYPTESIFFGSPRFDSEEFWARLLSFRAHEFLIGAACPSSTEGLIGRHAYSVLEVREVDKFIVAEGMRKHKATLEEFFGISVDGGSAASQRLERGRAGSRYFYSDLCLVILRLEGGTERRVHVEDIRMFGPTRTSHFDVVLGTKGGACRYLVIPFSVERQMATDEEKLWGSYESVGLAGMKKGRGSPSVPFTLRMLSAHVVQARELPSNASIGVAELVWDALDHALSDESIIHRKGVVGSPVLVSQRPIPSSCGTLAALRVFEASGIALVQMVIVHNGGKKDATDAVVSAIDVPTALEVRVSLKAATRTYTCTRGDSRRTVPLPNGLEDGGSVPQRGAGQGLRTIVGACVCPAHESDASGARVVRVAEFECRPVVSTGSAHMLATVPTRGGPAAALRPGTHAAVTAGETPVRLMRARRAVAA
ncbi:Calpain-type cysteine protease dek1, partial [Cladochytrium tenue]